VNQVTEIMKLCVRSIIGNKEVSNKAH